MRVVPFLFFNDTATTEIYTLSLHDALPISPGTSSSAATEGATQVPRSAASTGTRSTGRRGEPSGRGRSPTQPTDRKSTRLNSSHANISYAVFCLKKKSHTPPLTAL